MPEKLKLLAHREARINLSSMHVEMAFLYIFVATLVNLLRDIHEK